MFLLGVSVGLLSKIPSFLPLLQAKSRTTKANRLVPKQTPQVAPPTKLPTLRPPLVKFQASNTARNKVSLLPLSLSPLCFSRRNLWRNTKLSRA